MHTNYDKACEGESVGANEGRVVMAGLNVTLSLDMGKDFLALSSTEKVSPDIVAPSHTIEGKIEAIRGVASKLDAYVSRRWVVCKPRRKMKDMLGSVDAMGCARKCGFGEVREQRSFRRLVS